METTAGKAIINSMLPSGLQDYDSAFNKKTLIKIFNQVAEKHPEKYKDSVERIKKIGQKVSYIGGVTLSLKDFKTPIDRKDLFDAAKRIENKRGTASLDEIRKEFSALQKRYTDEGLAAGVKNGNVMALMVQSGARGKPSQFLSTSISPIMYSDQAGEIVPVPITHSLAEGLDAAEMFASASQTRKGVIATKFATPDSGFFNKQTGYVAGDLLITEADCNTQNGIKAKTDDSHNLGRLLAASISGFPRNTVLTPKILGEIIKDKNDNVIIRSPMTCQAKGGICKKCYGYTENGSFPELGKNIGINSTSALTEPFTQGAMNVKHGGGALGKTKSGLELVKQLVKVPKVFSGGASISEETGSVTKIQEAPQGGFYVFVDNVRHYVQPGFKILVSTGEYIEKGEPLSSGTINPADVTRLRGLGEGRKSLSDSLRQTYADDGKSGINKIHMETLSRAMVSNVKIDDHTEFDDNVPGDIIDIATAQENYTPKKSYDIKIDQATGKYLAKPYLHYTIGTQLTQKMINEIKSVGVSTVSVTDYEPPFHPVMVRLDDVPGTKANWIDRIYSIHLKKKLINSTQRADIANIHGNSFIPAMVYGKDFGKREIGY